MEILDVQHKLRALADTPGFSFDERYHSYSLGNLRLESATRFLSKFKKPFDQDKWSHHVAQRDGVSVEVVLDNWKHKAERSRGIGTLVHQWIEEYIGSGAIPEPTSDPVALERFNAWLKIWRPSAASKAILGIESRVFSNNFFLAGTADLIFSFEGRIIMADWKTNAKFTTESRFGDKLLPPFDDLDDCDLNYYSLQQSMYRLMFEEHGIKIGEAWLISLPEEGPAAPHRCLDLTQRLWSCLNDAKLAGNIKPKKARQ